MSGYDAWLTREPDWPEPPLPGEAGWPRCECGAWLPLNPEREEGWEETQPCDGKPEVVTSLYTKADAGLLDIIGWDFLDTSYTTEYDPICGQPREHPAHQYVVAAGGILFRTCKRCGKENREVTA